MLTFSTCLITCYYLKVTIIYGYKFYRILKIVDLAHINFSDFAIVCSINCERSELSGLFNGVMSKFAIKGKTLL